MPEPKVYTRYLVVKVRIEIPGDTDPELIGEIDEQVDSGLDCVVQFDDNCDVGTPSTLVPAKIITHECLALLDAKPLGVV